MDSEQRTKINTFFVQTFNYILLCEERAITKRGLSNLSTKEAHVIAAAINLAEEGRNIMSMIADELNISMRTVEVHRSRVFEKMGVRSAVELAQLLAPRD